MQFVIGKNRKVKAFATCLIVPLLLCGYESASAEVYLKKSQAEGGVLNRFGFAIGGSIRLRYRNKDGAVDDGSYTHRGEDGGTRFRFTGSLAIDENNKIVAYYEPGVDIPHVLGWSGHFAHDSRRIYTRQRYLAWESKTLGTIAVGKHKSPYYLAVGAKTDVWGNNGAAQAIGAGIDSDYDTSNKPRHSLTYEKKFDRLTVYLQGDAPADEHFGNALRLKRRYGGSAAFNYDLSDSLSLGGAYSYAKVSLRDSKRADQSQRTYRQQIVGTGLSWRPSENWYISGTANYFNNFAPDGSTTHIRNYFYRNVVSGELYGAYTWMLSEPYLQGIQLYAAADRLQSTSEHYQATREYSGLVFQFPLGFQLRFEKTFAQSTDHIAGETWVRLRYDF